MGATFPMPLFLKLFCIILTIKKKNYSQCVADPFRNNSRIYSDNLEHIFFSTDTYTLLTLSPYSNTFLQLMTPMPQQWLMEKNCHYVAFKKYPHFSRYCSL